ncbi:MAG: phosphoglycerate kinase [Acidobacteriota bacterium]
MPKKKTIRDVDLAGKTVLLRVDFNVPLQDGQVSNDRRIRASLPTMEALCAGGSRVICASHLGRPKGVYRADLSLAPVARNLSRLVDRPVEFVRHCRGRSIEEAAARLSRGNILLLENLRFDPGEESNDPAFAKALAAPASLYVNDAFGTAHRVHASTCGVTTFLSPAVAGLLMEKEIDALSKLLDQVRRPYVAVLGGAKIAGKIGLLENLLRRVDRVLVGGAMAYTFMRARGFATGASRIEEKHLAVAQTILQAADQKDIPLVLPRDHVVAASADGSQVRVTEDAFIPEGLAGFDIGPRTIEEFSRFLAAAGTVFWNGPLGLCERDLFARGTREVGEAIASCTGYTVAGGGDSIAAIDRFGLEKRFDHISTGGGASLEFLSGRSLPGIEALDSQET